MRVICVIPARYASERLPGKPLLDRTGKPLIQHVVDALSGARGLDEIIVATDDERIRNACERFGARAVMTSSGCRSGTDRVAEVVASLACDLVVNVQGDEPELPPAWVEALIEAMAHSDAPTGTVAVRCCDEAAFESPHVVKLVCDRNGFARYFSRAPIPYDRDTGGMPPRGFLHHVGIYAYRPDALAAIAGLPPSPLERTERLEQLRVLENGYAMKVVMVEGSVPGGIDTPEQYAAFVARIHGRHSGSCG